jgi:exodeoxyribonuclease-3
MNASFVDTFRYLHPDTEQYTWWSYRAFARKRNVGWRIDYFLISDSLKEKLKSATIYDQVMGSDHCPVGIELKK